MYNTLNPVVSNICNQNTQVLLKTGAFNNGEKGDGRKVEMIGMCRATVDDNIKIRKLEVFIDNDNFLAQCKGEIQEQATDAFAKPVYDANIHGLPQK